jgi:tetratricopeptide (TPR) repeat protein
MDDNNEIKTLINESKSYKAKYKYKKARKLLKESTLKNIDNDLDDNKGKKESLCLLGAVYKRKWEFQASFDDLYDAIKHYEKSYEEYKTEDMGYGGINASYLYDVLASKVKKVDEPYSQELEQKAKDLRQDIIKNFVDKKDKWLYHTLAQSYLGLDELEKCKEVLQEASQTYKYDDWEIFTTYKQLRSLANLRDINDLECLLPLVDDKHILEQSLDKKGLALSGGGFRASFFHLGILAKLAECDVLKDIEVISTVSGGTIVGVLYYLKLQKLLEENEDANIKKTHYIQLVTELIDEFFEAVQTDMRNGVFTERFFSNTILKIMNPFSSYSRTNKLGEIYQKRIYRKYKKYMSELIITPKDWQEKDAFKPRFNNWRRKNKVPILVINATNLNSGHGWQFQASKMGEAEYMNNMEIDKNNRFDWVRYDANGL